jgi:4-diphosphocytidyl-2-C-methyl-D-erythritol kinase
LKRITLTAPAKLNLSLEVIARRPDGYHEIRTILQTIDLADRVAIEAADELSLRTGGAGYAAGPDDDALKAARLLAKAVGRDLAAAIQIDKRIPAGAGLGGGGSDAAAVLRGLNRLFALGLSRGRLAELASEAGSDAPFFVYGGAALAEGRGQQVTPLPDIPTAWLVLLVPPLSVPRKTQTMYAALTEADFSDGSRTAALAESIRAGRPVEDAALHNAFERAAAAVFPQLPLYRDGLRRAAGRGVHLAGAGPSLFALCRSETEAREIASRVDGQGAPVYVARTTTAAEATKMRG